MTGTLRAFGCGVLVALIAVVIEKQVSTQAPAAGIEACVGADSTLRMTASAIPCAPGEHRMRLASPKVDQKPDCEEDDRRLASLQRRLKDLEFRDRNGTMRGRRAVAPFEVVLKNGTPILRVEEQNVTFYNADGKPVVWVLADASGGSLTVQTADGQDSVSVAALEQHAHVRIQEKGVDRIELGRRRNGRVGLVTYGTQDKVIAYIGQSELGSGLALVADPAGVVSARAIAHALSGGKLVVVNSQDIEVAGLYSGEGGAGRLQLTDGAGNPMVQAGVTGDVGVVRAGPGFNHSGVGILGLAPSYVIGKPRQ